MFICHISSVEFSEFIQCQIIEFIPMKTVLPVLNDFVVFCYGRCLNLSKIRIVDIFDII